MKFFGAMFGQRQPPRPAELRDAELTAAALVHRAKQALRERAEVEAQRARSEAAAEVITRCIEQWGAWPPPPHARVDMSTRRRLRPLEDLTTRARIVAHAIATGLRNGKL